MSTVLFVLVLSGCNDKNDDKKDCDKKGADWVWDFTKKECVAKATTKEACDAKGAGWVWDEANKKCNQSTAGLSDKDKCEAKGAGWVWDFTKKECVAKATTKEDCDEKGTGWIWDEVNKKCNQSTEGLSDKEKCEVKGAGWTWDETSKQCNPVVEYVTITVPDIDAITILDANRVERELIALVGFSVTALYAEHRINPGECIKVHRSHVPKMSIELSGSTGYKYLDVLCSSRGVSPCAVGNYGFVKVKSRSDMLELESLSGVDVDSCRELSPGSENKDWIDK